MSLAFMSAGLHAKRRSRIDQKGHRFSVDAKEVINPANYSVLINFVRESFVAESQSYLLVKIKDGYLER